jgi:hypothetical protein
MNASRVSRFPASYDAGTILQTHKSVNVGHSPDMDRESPQRRFQLSWREARELSAARERAERNRFWLGLGLALLLSLPFWIGAALLWRAI